MDNSQLTPEQIQQMIVMLQQMLPGVANETKKPRKTRSTSNKKTNTKNNPIKTKKTTINNQHHDNKFLEMSEMSMHKSDTVIDKKLAKFPPTPRSRTFEPITVVCRVCGKTEHVHPKLVLDSVDRYKCNSCSTSQG